MGLISSASAAKGLGVDMLWKTVQMVSLSHTASWGFWVLGTPEASVLCYDGWPTLPLDTVWDKGLAQGADIYRVNGKPLEMAPFLIKLMEMCGAWCRKYHGVISWDGVWTWRRHTHNDTLSKFPMGIMSYVSSCSTWCFFHVGRRPRQERRQTLHFESANETLQ